MPRIPVRILTILLTAAALSTNAHTGGHGHGESGRATNRWQLADGSLVEGTFLYGDAGRLVLQKSDGSRIGIPLEALSGRDRRLAEFRMRRGAALNGQILPKSTHGDS